MKKYDAIIIGAGQAGVPLAMKLAAAGWKTVLVEKRWIGGTCVNDGCTPTKTMIASGRVAYLVGRSGDYGIEVNNYSIHLPTIKKRKDDLVLASRHKNEKALQETEGLTLLFGEASFTGGKIMTVQLNQGGQEEISAEKIFLDTGAQPNIPEIDGLKEIDYLTSTSILDLEEVPEHLLILGASYIALEYGQLFKRLGSKVTLLEHSKTFLSKEDQDIADELQTILEEDGLQILKQAEAKKFTQTEKGQITAQLEVAGHQQEVNCSHVLVAMGRPPQTKALQLEKAGINTNEHGHIQVNEFLETNVTGIFALGDVKGGPAFTHIAYNDYVIVSQNLLEGKQLSTKNQMQPYCLYTDPELGRIGLTEKEARAKNLNFKLAKMPMKQVARANETAESRGMIKALVDADTKLIIGAAVLGVQGGELMTVLQMAMMGGLTYEQIRDAVFAHPTFAESLNNLFSTLEDA